MAFETSPHPFNINIFANFVCYVLPKKIILPKGNSLESFPIGVDIESLESLMNLFKVKYGYEYLLIMRRIKAKKINTFTLFMKTVMARCLKLSEPPVDYGLFLHACSLILRICAEYLGTTDCFLCVNLCHSCLISLYNRRYKEYFESRVGTFDSLDRHTQAYLQFLLAQDSVMKGRELEYVGMSDSQRRMRSVVIIDEESITLTEEEKEMMIMHTGSVPRDHPPVLRTMFDVQNNINLPNLYTYEGALNISEDSSSMPEDSSSTPEDSSSTPEDSSVMPEDSSVKPEDSSVKPEGSSVKPKDSSSTPEESSPMAEDSSTSTSSEEEHVGSVSKRLIKSSEEESASSISKRPIRSSVAESIVTDFPKASTSAAADKAEEVDSETESEKSRVQVKRPIDDCARYYKNIGYRHKRKRLDKPECPDETSSSSSSSSNVECDVDDDRVPDMYYFGNLMCKFCRSRCSCYAVLFIERYCEE